MASVHVISWNGFTEQAWLNHVYHQHLKNMAGYHRRNIPKGKLGKISKIDEEYLELQDAIDQNNPVMVICELCDIIGAIEAYAANYKLTLDDLVKMKDATKSAFQTGYRK